MRCPDCDAWCTPNQPRCSRCDRRLDDSPFQRYSRAIEQSRERWNVGHGSTSSDANLAALTPPEPEDLQTVLDSAALAPLETVTVQAESIGFLNLLLLHSGFSPLRTLRIVGGQTTANTEIRLRSQPEFFPPVRQGIADIDVDGLLPAPRVTPDLDAFGDLEESASAQLVVELIEAGEVTATWREPLIVQAANEWVNVPAYAAALACVVTPNAAAVSRFVNSIRRDFLAYQVPGQDSITNEVRTVYQALADLALHYIPEPPSFDRTGQKVLFPEQVLVARQGCCLDIVVLTCAILERAGHNPLVVLVDGHACSAIWTADIRSRQPLLRDRDRVRQAVADGDLLVWNSTTYFNPAGHRDFDTALAEGRRALATFQYAVDIKACRDNPFPRFLPLATRRS